MLSRQAREFATEIRNHDWRDSPWRLDKAGHRHDDDAEDKRTQLLSDEEAENIRTNVMWVVAQVLAHSEADFKVHEFAAECGVPRRITHRKKGIRSGRIPSGIRKEYDGTVVAPGTYPEKEAPVDPLGW